MAKERKIKRMALGGVPSYEFGQGYEYIEIDDIPEVHRKDFDEWLYGQTCPLVEDVKNTAYSHDWERFFKLKTQGTPTYFD